MPWNADTPHEKVLKQKQALMTDVNLKKIYPPEIQGITVNKNLQNNTTTN